MAIHVELLIPEVGPGESYPGDITPGLYSQKEIAELLRLHKANPDAIQFIADMLEE